MGQSSGGRKLTTPRMVVLAGALALVLAACGSTTSSKSAAKSTSASSPTSSAPSSSAVQGGTATLAEGAQGTPNYIFPLDPAADLTVANIGYFQGLIYRPLYFYGGDGYGVGLNPKKSLAYPPVYTDGGKTVIVKLKHYQWSDGKPVTSRDVTFFMNLLVANKAQYGNYVKGKFPDNVTSYQAKGPYEVVFHLNRAYNQAWFTGDELSNITPLPQHAWDKTSATGKVGNYDTTTKGAKAVYNFLAGQAKDTSTYNTNPLWKVVDGPWKMTHFDNTGHLTFVPNPRYSGPDKPHLSKFEELPFTSDSAQFDTLLTGNQLSVGYLPAQDLGRQSLASRAGYHPLRWAQWQINYIDINFNNPQVGPIFHQLYIRQALQHLMDQTGDVKTILDGKGGYPDYGPIPPKPANPYLSKVQESNPYPFSISAARKLLQTHGWKIPASGPATCTRPGAGAGHCGAGIKAGQQLKFNLLYLSGSSYMQREMEVYKSDAGQAGIVLSLSSAPFNTVVSETLPCTPSQAQCKWQMGNWGAGFAWSYPPVPTGELLFQTGAPDGNSYSSPTADRLINDTIHSNSSAVMKSYDAYLSRNLPVIWQMCTYTISEVSNKLHGVSFNPVGPITPEDWYLTK